MARWGLYGCQGTNLVDVGNLDELLTYHRIMNFKLRLDDDSLTFVGSYWDGNKTKMMTIKKMPVELAKCRKKSE